MSKFVVQVLLMEDGCKTWKPVRRSDSTMYRFDTEEEAYAFSNKFYDTVEHYNTHVRVHKEI